MKGLEIRKILQQKGITLQRVADLLETSNQNLSSLLSKDDIKTGLVERISEATGISLSELYGINPSAVNTGTNNGNIAGRDITDNTQLADLHSIIAQQQKTISELSATIAKLVK